MDTKEIRQAKRLVLDFLEDVPASVYLFGSWARGEQRRTSDMDIAVDCRAPSSRRKIRELRDLLEESRLPFRVDVVNMQEASPRILEAIRREGIPWRS